MRVLRYVTHFSLTPSPLPTPLDPTAWLPENPGLAQILDLLRGMSSPSRCLLSFPFLPHIFDAIAQAGNHPTLIKF